MFLLALQDQNARFYPFQRNIIPHLPISIKNVNFASIIIEEKELIKFSFRSVGRFSVNDFAKNHFNGGGHKNAAGGRLDENLDVALSKFLKLVRENKQKLIY